MIGSLCSGYGGLDMAIGLPVSWHAESDKYVNRILEHNYPGVPNHGDITSIDWGQVEPVEWLTAGYPCQPFSLAGHRLGVLDPRHIWPDIAECVRRLRPRHIFLENVRSHLGSGFGSVLGDLANLGYDAAWCVVNASDAGAPHRRERIFILATDTNSLRQHGTGRSLGWAPGRFELADRSRAIAYPDSLGPQGSVEYPGQDSERSATDCGGQQVVRYGADHWGEYYPAISRWEAIIGRPAPLQVEPGVRRDWRLSAKFMEWDMGLPDGHVTDVPGLAWTRQIKALGNGVVPQQARLALEILMEM